MDLLTLVAFSHLTDVIIGVAIQNCFKSSRQWRHFASIEHPRPQETQRRLLH